MLDFVFCVRLPLSWQPCEMPLVVFVWQGRFIPWVNRCRWLMFSCSSLFRFWGENLQPPSCHYLVNLTRTPQISWRPWRTICPFWSSKTRRQKRSGTLLFIFLFILQYTLFFPQFMSVLFLGLKMHTACSLFKVPLGCILQMSFCFTLINVGSLS